MPGTLVDEWIEHHDDIVKEQSVETEYTRADSAFQKAEIKRRTTLLRRIHPTDVQEQFTQLANTWKQDTAHLSNMTTRAMHPAYQRIIGMGREAIPLILEEFKQGRLDDWFWALYAITGENPIPEEIAGDMDQMAEAWLQWGRETGYLSDSIQPMRPSSRT